MRGVVIEDPVINSPFAEPERHFRFDDEGITSEIAAGRRVSSYFMPIPKAKKKGKGGRQLTFAPSGRRTGSRKTSSSTASARG